MCHVYVRTTIMGSFLGEREREREDYIILFISNNIHFRFQIGLAAHPSMSPIKIEYHWYMHVEILALLNRFIGLFMELSNAQLTHNTLQGQSLAFWHAIPDLSLAFELKQLEAEILEVLMYKDHAYPRYMLDHYAI
ncbi:hypothetical protein ACJX0J_027329 [Zea mays]